MIIPASSIPLMSILMASSGFPGSQMNVGAGNFNPMVELIRGWAQEAQLATTAAVSSSNWLLVPPATPRPGPPGSPGPLAPTVPLFTPPQSLVFCLAVVATSGRWSGPMGLQFLRVWVDAIVLSFTSSPYILTVPPATIAALAGALPGVYQFKAAPISRADFSSRLRARWDANPKFGGEGDPSQRKPLADFLAEATDRVWQSIAPISPSAGIAPAPPPPPSLPAISVP